MKSIFTLLLFYSSYFLVAQDTLFYDADAIKGIGIYQNGLKMGTWKYYYPDGTQSAIFNYVEGKLNGLQLYFDENGALIAEENWFDDLQNDSTKNYYPGGNLKRKGILKEGLYEGVWIYYHENGHKAQVGAYVNGLPEGVWTFYHENGQISQTGSYQMGELRETWLFYNEKGKLKRKKRYR